MANEIITSAIDFLKKIKEEKFVTVEFTKQDGTTRIMKCTLNFPSIPPKDKPSSLDLEKILKLIRDNNILHVYDLEKKGWRSCPFDKVKWIENPQKVRYLVKISKEKER